MNPGDPLIHTKLRRPFTRPGLVPRARLLQKMEQGLRGPLTLVSAPAGFGKTTLVAGAVAACGLPAAWLSLDGRDNQVGRFLNYLVAAVREANPAAGAEAAQMGMAPEPAPPEAVLTSLINDLDHSGGELVLVLDDYHFIHNPEVHSAVAFLLQHAPRSLRLVISSRSDPPLPIARLRARGQAVELRAADLRFTADEAAQFLNDLMGLSLDGAIVAALEERTEGWAVGLQMAALSMRERRDLDGFIAGFSGTNRYILDYLLEEVLAGQPTEIQRFLLYTSVLDQLSAPLCDALFADDAGETGPANAGRSAERLAYLERENLFLTPLDDEQRWFRYHHLFADLLRSRLREADPACAPRLHRRASAWLEEAGLVPEAVQHLFAIPELERAADLIERYGPARWEQGDLAVIQMADGLPDELLASRPRLGIYRAWLFILQGYVEQALPLLNRLAQAPCGVAWIDELVGLARAFLSRPGEPAASQPLPDYPDLVESIPAGEPVLRDAAGVLYGMTLGRRGQVVQAAVVAEEAIARELSRPGSAGIPNLVPFLADMYMLQGRLRDAAALCRRYLDPIQEQDSGYIYALGTMNIVYGETLYEWNFPQEAERHIRAGLRSNEPWRNIITDAYGLLALIRLLLARKDCAAALQTVEKFERRLRGQPGPFSFKEDLLTLRVRVQLAAGDLPGAAAWADQAMRSEDFQRHPRRYRFTLARIRLAQERFAEAEALLAPSLDDNPTGISLNHQIEIHLLLAVAAAGQGRPGDAAARLETALVLAEPEGYLRTIIDQGEAVRPLLSAYLRGPAPRCKAFAQRLLDAFPPPETAPAVVQLPDGLVEALTEREIEVLRLIALGKTNQEIAAQLVVARGTIKAHAASIFRKLDVANRTEAVARARQLGLLA